jgi:hypothetical protein
MREKTPLSRWQMLGVGCAAGAAGVYLLLLGAGILPVPGGPGNLHGPLWLVSCVGIAFFLAGAALTLQAAGRANDQGELPADAPSWMHLLQYLIGVAIFVAFALIGSWVAFGAGERAFSGSFGLVSGGVDAAVGRTVFGAGAIISWLASIALAVSGLRKLRGRQKSGPR